MDKIVVGSSAELSLSWTQGDIERFIDLSGDGNNIHLSIEAASRSPIGAMALPGMLPALAFSRILGTMCPGDGTVYRSQEIQFRRPMVPQRPYVVRVTVLKLRPKHHLARFSTEIIDGLSGEVVTRGRADVIHYERL